MAINADAIKLGSCWIFYDNEDLGCTFNDSIVISSEMTVKDIQPDQSGSPVKSYVIGNPVMVDMELGEVQRKKLATLIPGASMDSGDLKMADATGADLRSTGKPLTLIPVDGNDNDIYYFPLAGVVTNLNLKFTRDSERVLPVKFKSYPDTSFYIDPTYGTGGVMAIIDRPAKALTYSAAGFSEAVANDGSIDNTTPMTIELAGVEYFTGADADDFVAAGKIVVTNLPTSLTAVITRTHSRKLSVVLNGTADSHTSANDVANLTFTFQDSAFVGGTASDVTDYAKSDLTISFAD